MLLTCCAYLNPLLMMPSYLSLLNLSYRLTFALTSEMIAFQRHFVLLQIEQVRGRTPFWGSGKLPDTCVLRVCVLLRILRPLGEHSSTFFNFLKSTTSQYPCSFLSQGCSQIREHWRPQYHNCPPDCNHFHLRQSLRQSCCRPLVRRLRHSR